MDMLFVVAIYVLMIFVTAAVIEYFEPGYEGILGPSILWPITAFIALGIVPVRLAKKLVRRIKEKND